MTLGYDYNTIKENRKKAKKSHGINTGSISLIMIFTVLCLTVFAILTLVSANAEYKLCVKYSESIKEYYENDYNASEFINTVCKYSSESSSDDDIMRKVQGEADYASMVGDILVIEKAFSISENFELAVTLEVANGKVEIVSYIYNAISDMAEPQFNINIWTGDAF
jgi:hypothetical protein